MPVLKSHVLFEAVQGFKSFLHLEVGVTRGEVHSSEQELRQAQSQVRKQNQQIQRLRKQLSSKTRNLEQVRKQLSDKNRNLKLIRRRLAAQDRKPIDTKVQRNDVQSARKHLAYQYLNGSGLEIGALHRPLEVPPNVSVRNVDRMTVEQLREQYPNLSNWDLTPVDIVDDGESLSSIADGSADFVIANHMIEHCQNPIATLENHLRVLKPDGILYMAVPDKRFTFDQDRPVTLLEHLVRDYTEGPGWSKVHHFKEWVRLVAKVPDNEVAVHTQKLAEKNYSIHFHVWTPKEFLEMLLYCQSKLHFQFDIEVLQRNSPEFVVILSKQLES